MKPKLLAAFAAAACVTLFAAPDAKAQFYSGYNPYTNRFYQGQRYYNPYAGGVVQTERMVNPATGSVIYGTNVYNPVYRTNNTELYKFNPYTGQSAYRYRYRGW